MAFVFCTRNIKGIFCLHTIKKNQAKRQKVAKEAHRNKPDTLRNIPNGRAPEAPTLPQRTQGKKRKPKKSLSGSKPAKMPKVQDQ